MTHLCIDTSTRECLLALHFQGRILESIYIPHSNNLSKALLPQIQALLARHDLTPSSLTTIDLGIGPGSYTGVRVGAATAKTLSFALSIPIRPFLSPLAFIPQSVDGPFSIFLPSKAGPIFTLQGLMTHGAISKISDCFLSCDEMTLHLQQKERHFIGPDHTSPELNLESLLPFLDQIKPLAAQEVFLTYLHHPSPILAKTSLS